MKSLGNRCWKNVQMGTVCTLDGLPWHDLTTVFLFSNVEEYICHSLREELRCSLHATARHKHSVGTNSLGCVDSNPEIRDAVQAVR